MSWSTFYKNSFFVFTLILAASITVFAQDQSPNTIKIDNQKNDNGPVETEDKIFRVAEQMPRFPGCEELGLEGRKLELCAKEKMLEYINDNLVYPSEARKQKIEGTVVVQFLVLKDGSLSDMKIVRDLKMNIDCSNCPITCGQAALELLDIMNTEVKWIPGKSENKTVIVQYTLPIKFKL